MLPKQHPLAQLTEIPVGQLNGLAITVLSQKLSQPLFDTIVHYIEQRQIQFQTISKANSIAESIQAVHSGQSCAILPSYMQALATDQIVMRRLSHSLPCLDVFFSYNRHEPSLATEQFLEEIRQIFELDMLVLHCLN